MANNYLSKERFYWPKVLLDGLFLALAFITVYWLRRNNLRIDEAFRPFLPLLFLTWFLVTVFSKKFKVLEKKDYFALLQPYWLAAIFFVLLLTIMLYALGWVSLSRFIIYGTISLYLILEVVFLALFRLLRRRRHEGLRIPFAVFFFFIEFLVICASFFLIYFSKRATFRLDERYQVVLMGIFFAWLLLSLLLHRFEVKTRDGLWQAFQPFWQAEALILGLVIFYSFVPARGSMSRLIIFGSIGAFILLENLVVSIYYVVSQFKRAEEDPAELLADELAHAQVAGGDEEESGAPLKEKYRFQETGDSQEILKKKLGRLFLNKFQDVYDFIKKHVDLARFDILSSAFLFASDIFNIDIFEDDSLSFFFNFERVNNFRYVNRVCIALNRKMKMGGVFIGCFESYDQRRERIFGKFPRWFARVFYVVDFCYKRIMPKLPLLKNLYFALSKGRKRVFSRTEVLGRLYYCGFEVIGLRPISGIYYFIAKKTSAPRSDPRPSYGPVFRQRRLGQGGKIIYIYKLRTMHPFAEYLHQYIFDKHRLEDTGKIKDDFRITSWGRFFRKTWLDELPMLINWLKRDIKLVGVRPLSETFFKTYPADLQKERNLYKPGLIPPFYVDMPVGIEQVWESERRYLARYKKHPVLTDFVYFFKAFNNILFHHAKSS